MKTVQLIGTGVVAMLFAVGACNRGATSDEAQRAAAEAREAAGDARATAEKAGERLANSWLTTKIQAQYFADQDVKARYINVSALDGVVTLKGRVDNENAHEQAVQIAKNTDGVRQVIDQLAVGPPSAPRTGDQNSPEWIVTRIQARYFADPDIGTRDIQVHVNDGVVTLSGRVASEREKQEAVGIARSVEGVAQVDDRLTVQAVPDTVATTGSTTASELARRLDDSRVTSSIQAKYFLDNTMKTRRLDVTTRQGVVTLRGEVASDDERAQALLLARTTEGVDRVEDNLTVNPSVGQAAAALPNTARPNAPATAPSTPAPSAQAPAAEDATVTRAVQSRLSDDRLTRDAKIEVMARDGVVLLEGTVASMAVKQRILTLARETKGVLQVVDRITVRRGR
jgi:hyperosmotically inducible protein